MKQKRLILMGITFCLLLLSVQGFAADQRVTPLAAQTFIDEVEQDLKGNILPFWLRHVNAPDGGFYGEVSSEGRGNALAPRGAILGARILWTFSAAYRLYKQDDYRKMADRTQQYFINHFVDQQYGGVYWTIAPSGEAADATKMTYALAFAIYGLSEHYRATGNEASLKAAQTVFRTLEDKVHDHQLKGYREGYNRDFSAPGGRGYTGNPVATKTMNTHIHVMEAYTNLYRVWPNAELRKCLLELVDILQTKLYNPETGHLILFCDDNWKMLETADSYGHDIETAWLLCETADVLGDASLQKAIRQQALRMTDAALEGMNPDGSMNYEKNRRGLNRRLQWWPQSETVVGCLNAWQLTGEQRYFDQAQKTWRYIQQHFVDRQYGEWHRNLTPEGVSVDDPKVSLWHCPYHNSRMAFEVAARLHKAATNYPITGEYLVPKVPDWARNAVFYQIYPQTFCDSDGDGIGDLQGIISKLDYVKSLGVDAIWLNPFFDSPFNDAGYDVRDYYKIAPRYGTNDDARQLFEEAHKRGLHVIFDYVISYTAIDHPWFVASQKQEKNKYSNYYIWTETNWVDPPREFAGQFIKGYGERNGQFMRNFYWCQPALNFGFANPDPEQKWQLPTDHPDVMAMREDLKNVLRFWMDMGADGFRADMAGALVKTRHVRGNEQFFNTNENATKLFWREIRRLLEKEYPQGFMVAEWSYPSDALDDCFHVDFFHWFRGYNDLFQKESWRILNGVSEGHSYFDAEGKGNITDFLKTYMDQYQRTLGKGYISLPLGNHDNARLGNHRTAKELELIYAFGFTMPGVPFLYYGNEIGMRQLPNNWPQVEGAYQPRNGARTPMQWTSGKNLGFSSGSPENLYLPVDPEADAPNVADQESDPNSLLNRTRQLIRLRHTEPALANYAEFAPVYAETDTYPFVYARAAGKDVVLVMLNPRAEASEATFSINVPFKSTRLLLGDKFPIKHNKKAGQLTIQMPATSYAIIKLQ